MKKLIRLCALLGAVALLALFVFHFTPRAKKARLQARAGRDFNAGHFDAAEIEYLNLLRADRRNPAAIGRLGIIYFDQGRGGMSLPYLVEGRSLQPDDLAVRLRLGLSYLAQGAFPKARAEADYILARNPRDGDALLLLAEAAVQPGDIADARHRLEPLTGPPGGSAPALVALGTLEFRRRQFPEAEGLFKRALGLDPMSSDACTALGALYWAENNLALADQAFAKAAALAPGRMPKELQHAEFKIETGDRDAARRILEEMTRKNPDFLPADLLLAELDESDKKPGESAALVAKVLDRAPAYFDALLLWGRLKLAAGKPAEAVAGLEKARGIYPHSPEIEYELAQACVAAGAPEKAIDSLNRAVAWDANLTGAAILLAQLRLQTGDPASAIVALKQVLQKRPGLTQARFLLASASIAQNDLDGALAAYRQLAADDPEDPQAVLFAGMVALHQDKKEEARRDFDRALALAPDSPLALVQRVDLDLDEKLPAAALQRVQGRIAKSPARADLYVLLGTVFLAEHAWDQAEAACRKAIALQPGPPPPYLLLAELYSRTGRDPQALADLRELIARDPGEKQALMLMGTIQERDGDHGPARATYEKLLALDPNFSPALNNLAYLYAENSGELDKAFDLAQRARKLLPGDPRVADTLGWILYKEHRYAWALTLLRESSDNLPADAQVEFHLGMACAMVGDEGAARLALQRALQLDAGFPGSSEARQDLAVLAIDAGTAGAGARALLEKAAADRPGDPMVLSRLAAIYEGDGDQEKAIGIWEAALRQNPEDEPALVRLARLYAARGDTAKALALAKSARALAPDDPEAAHVLGVLAYRTHDQPWSVSLLTETVDRQPDDSEAAFDLAKAWYSVGRVAEATASLRNILGAKDRFSRRTEARRMLDLIEAGEHPLAADRARVATVLGGDPGDVPALMALGAIDLRGGDPAAARAEYEKALEQDPDFFPAEKSLVLLYAGNPGDDPKAPGVATRAREAFPDDPEVAKACGIVMYRTGNYTMAEALLGEGARQGGGDGELTFYLGMARYRLNEPSARKTLERALTLDLPAGLAAEARLGLARLKQDARAENP